MIALYFFDTPENIIIQGETITKVKTNKTLTAFRVRKLKNKYRFEEV